MVRDYQKSSFQATTETRIKLTQKANSKLEKENTELKRIITDTKKALKTAQEATDNFLELLEDN